MKRPPRIIDEFTYRTDLTSGQKYKLRHPEKFRQIQLKQNEKARNNWNASPIKARRAKWLKTKYGITYDQYQQMYDDQNGKCKICEIEISIITSTNNHQTACVDHCHSTNKIRGLLCNHCNRALGLMKESVENLKKLIMYLEDNL